MCSTRVLRVSAAYALAALALFGCGGNGGNSAPLAQDVYVSTPLDTPVGVTLLASDADGDALTYEVVNGPSYGTLSGSGAELTYAPASWYSGADTFTYRVRDGHAYSEDATATVSVGLSGSNYPPVARDFSVDTTVDTPLMLTLAASDADGDSLSYEVLTPPSPGSLLGSGAIRTYEPEAGYTGTDDFTFRAHDGQDYSGTATGTVSISPGPHSGIVWAWGSNSSGQLGQGTVDYLLSRVQVQGLTGVVAIDTGDEFCVALRADGTVWTWGSNYGGKLGDGTTGNRLTPVQVAGLAEVVEVAAGRHHCLALKTDGTVWAWGGNSHGQLGDGTTENRHIHVQVKALAGVTAIAAGDFHSFALEEDGTLWAWGYNLYGQLGDGTNEWRYAPVEVPVVTSAEAIAAGTGHSVVLKTDGTVWAWGGNSYGQLDEAGAASSYTPVQIQGLTNVGGIAARLNHSLAFKSDGSVWAWGWNIHGQIGDGTTSDRRELTQVLGGDSGDEFLTEIAAIAAGSTHCLALKTDGTAWAWGRNQERQLGDGTDVERHTPVQVQGLPPVSAIAGGDYHSLAIKE